MIKKEETVDSMAGKETAEGDDQKEETVDSMADEETAEGGVYKTGFRRDGNCRVMITKGMVFRYTWVYSKKDTMAHTCRLVVTS